jgi:large subunit ribosomal protein L6
MSRIGKSPIINTEKATITKNGMVVSVSGPKGTLSYTLPSGITLSQDGDTFTILCEGKDTKIRALHGYVRANIANMIIGVTKGFTKTLELVGVGYRAAVTGANLVLNVGFSHQVTITPPQGVTFTIVEGKIVVSGIDKQAVGQVASNIRKVKVPEPYKGKGIRYVGEHVRKKAGKSAKGATGAGAK